MTKPTPILTPEAVKYIQHAHQILSDYTGDDKEVLNAHGLLSTALSCVTSHTEDMAELDKAIAQADESAEIYNHSSWVKIILQAARKYRNSAKLTQTAKPDGESTPGQRTLYVPDITCKQCGQMLGFHRCTAPADNNREGI